MGNITNIRFSETQSFSKLILDYLSARTGLEVFYQYPLGEKQIPAVAAAKQKENIDRKVLAGIIHQQYSGLDIHPLVKSNTDALENENTFCVVTAHQLNIFTGPLYYIYKIACAINASNHLTSLYPQYNFVPVYWMGSEDHDFEEINHIHLFGKSLEWPDKQGGATGNYSPSSLSSLIGELKIVLGDLPFANELSSVFETAYSKPNLADATRFLVNALFGQYGLLIVDGNCTVFKQQFIHVMEDELVNQISCELVNEQIEKLDQLGYKSQAAPREINLFYLGNHSRERIVCENSQYGIRNTQYTFTKDEILAELHAHPGKFSPNVILRPLFQQKILPSVAYIGGGGELSYWLQLKPVFEKYQINFPQLILRNSVLLLNENQQSKMDKLGLSAADLFKDIDVLKKEYISRFEEQPVEFNAQKKAISRQFEEIQHRTKLIDASLVNTIGAELQKTLQAIEGLEKRLLKSLKQKNETELNQLEKLKQQLFPGNELQERYENFSPYYARKGRAFLDHLVAELNPYTKEFLIIPV